MSAEIVPVTDEYKTFHPTKNSNLLYLNKDLWASFSFVNLDLLFFLYLILLVAPSVLVYIFFQVGAVMLLIFV